ncbi:MAG: alanine--tRNA ligase, partial [Pseudomonadota bacterium]|nr:alanine--tRNA ligase [Pseudomonadota bacterium]
VEEAIATMQSEGVNQFSGELVFRLYDTYGFPVDLTADLAREKGFSIDEEGFDACMEAQRERARHAGKFDGNYHKAVQIDETTEFLGYTELAAQATVVALVKGGDVVSALHAGDTGYVVLNQTSFYAESGGQVGDKGLLIASGVQLEVKDTTKQGAAFLHHVVVTKGQLQVGDAVQAQVNASARQATERNHSATHLMHAALRKVLGEHVEQKGSLVTADYLRFDFSHPQALSAEELAQIEHIVNHQILLNQAVCTEEMSFDDAVAKGAMALFGEKYDSEVRVLSMGVEDFSVELCGGTHVRATGDIGSFAIQSEGGVASGIRRIEAITGEGALRHYAHTQQLVNQVADALKSRPELLVEKVTSLLGQQKELQKQVEQLKMKLASGSSNDLMEQVQTVAGIQVLAARMDDLDAKSLRAVIDQYKQKIKSGVIVLATGQDEKVGIAVGVTQDQTAKVKAGDLVRQLAEIVGGRGGGRPDFAQAGGSDIAKLNSMIQSVPRVLEKLTG